tara:strand:+ start:1446 stop:1664 length:219 start_codon:yes stop_codon:yes gene_type:complete
MFKKSFFGWLFAKPDSFTSTTVVKVMTKIQMKKLSKLQLETMGRENGIELDRRKTKDKLIIELHKKLTKKVK